MKMFVFALLSLFAISNASAGDVDTYQEPNLEKPPAYLVVFITDDGRTVNYTVDNQFADIDQNRNLSAFYGEVMNVWAVRGMEGQCAEDEGVPCTLINIDQLKTAPRLGGTALPLRPEDR